MTQLPDSISITWHVDDVLQQRPDLTREQARQVLRELDRDHDATVGINWDVIDCTAETLFPTEA